MWSSTRRNIIPLQRSIPLCSIRSNFGRIVGSFCRKLVGTYGSARQPQSATRHSKKAHGAANRQTGRSRKMKLTIAIEGCCHGELDKIYATLQLLEKREGKKIDLLLCCGDFQAVRNLDDLETMACPPKYRSMQTFFKYYSGERVAPFPTIFIGGNHEAANHLWELYYGGWAAPNIYFLGFAGAVKFGGLRIAGLSGIYKQHDYMRGHHEKLPYTDNTMRSVYHVRDFEVFRLLQLQQPVDIFLSHDWPTGIAQYGNTQQLLARKAFLRSEVETGTLGSPPAAQLLAALRPAYWFSAHLHTKFAALVQHPPPPQQQQQQQQQQHPGAAARESSAVPPAGQPSEGTDAADTVAAAAGPGPSGGAAAAASSRGGFSATRFLALDKCLPGREFLQVIEMEAPQLSGKPELQYDEEWLAILRSTHQLTNLDFKHMALPGMGGQRSGPRPEDLEFVQQTLAARGTSRVPDNFVITAEPYNPALGQRQGRMPQRHQRNPQTVALLEMLGLPYNLDHHDPRGKGPPATAPSRPGCAPLSLAAHTPRGPQQLQQRVVAAAAPLPTNPEEIDLGDLDADEADEQQQEQQAPLEQEQQETGGGDVIGTAGG
ncbi:hypothetical protein Vretimale_1395 [Volvox reticuliferus]|uniref:Lariat debranching enzyme C-terminal domain-containing protein n=1 Tax=Volvox reticuliferus TaxID=1737510 RepID=A0A8J4D577_9CHLO|nr:hypothetical protein Vretifemale_10789 [Volvox reticuliferus]GIL95352.1 hypothetical protein Vretimale_1395 [Volvox reticuliferus]